MNKKWFICFCAITMLSHCSPNKNDAKPSGVLTDAQQQTLQKAKEVNSEVSKAAEERIKAIEESQ